MKCVDCGTPISRLSARCKRDAAILREGMKERNIKGLSCGFCSKPLSRAAKLGVCRECCGRIPEWGQKISLRQRIKVASGNHHWGTGKLTGFHAKIRQCHEMREWIRAVFERDDFTCQYCGERGGALSADHIVPFAQIMREHKICSLPDALNCTALWDINNGRTLCRPCHKDTPTWGARTRLKMYRYNENFVSPS